LDADKSAWLKERNDIFRKSDDLVYLQLNFLLLSFQLAFLAQQIFVNNRQA
jgi:hypothetical protein